MGAAVLRRRRRQRLPGPLGGEARRQVDRDRSGAHSPEDWVGQHACGVESAVRGEAPGALTLDDLIAGTWEELSVCEIVCCPVCGGKMASGGGGMASRGDVPDGAPHGDCVDCGTRLR